MVSLLVHQSKLLTSQVFHHQPKLHPVGPKHWAEKITKVNPYTSPIYGNLNMIQDHSWKDSRTKNTPTFGVRSTEQFLCTWCFLTGLRIMFLFSRHRTCRYYRSVLPQKLRLTAAPTSLPRCYSAVEAQVSMALRYPSVPPNRSQRARRQCQWLHELPASMDTGFPGIAGFRWVLVALFGWNL